MGRLAAVAGAAGCRMAVIGMALGSVLGAQDQAPGAFPLAAARVVRVFVARVCG